MMTNSRYDFSLILLFSFLAYFSVYYLPFNIRSLLFLSFLVLQVISKEQKIWIALLIFISLEPSRMFSSHLSNNSKFIVPIFDFIGSNGLSYLELSITILIMKSIFKPVRNKTVFSNLYKFIIFYGVFLIFYSLILGIGTKSYILGIRQFYIYILILALPRILTFDDIKFIAKFIFIIFSLTFIDQFFDLFFQTKFIPIPEVKSQIKWGSQYIRSVSSVTFNFFTLFFCSLFYKKNIMSNKIISLLIILSSISIIMTGLRGWILALIIFHLLFFVFIQKKSFKDIVIYYLSPFVALILAVYFIPALSKVLSSNFDRLLTIFLLINGDMTAGNTLLRISYRLPLMLEGLKSNIIFGHGISKTFFLYKDGHIGLINQILQFGLFGFGLFIFAISNFFSINIGLRKYVKNKQLFFDSPLVISISLIFLIIIHLTSRTMFNFTMTGHMIYLVVFFLSFSDIIITESITNDKLN